MQAALFKKNAILMEQDALHHRLYEDVLGANGFDVYGAKSTMDGFMKIKEKSYDIALINLEIAEESFIEKLINKIHSEQMAQFMPIVGISIYGEERKRNVAKILDAFLTKPFSIDRLMECVLNSIERKNGCENPCDQRL
jgi:DNA-binding response OmpR family regulator